MTESQRKENGTYEPFLQAKQLHAFPLYQFVHAPGLVPHELLRIVAPSQWDVGCLAPVVRHYFDAGRHEEGGGEGCKQHCGGC